MTPLARPAAAPRWIVGCWAGAILCGAAALLVAGSTSQAGPRTLGPTTLASYLERAAGPDAHDIRVNGVYGSAHYDAWQFVAHLTWHDAAGVIHGGTTNLPTLAGGDTLASEFGPGRLIDEESIGWPLSTLTAVMDRIPGNSSVLALVELQITPQAASVVACTAGADHQALCRMYDRNGRTIDSFDAGLSDEPSAGALAVQRGS